ncbi:trafficking protein particle complex subunit 13-like [Actinia tenebrosa]|uniref:Trafficking protein particle complex subunit 13-like n=1 Tax=Actinia tenebrosa TaxID=6105 RepID=A0A6P8HK50_ACTTE|nr:trafficking protein particle complex subunit 13-like [Actinia tenebrosa]
MDSGLREREHLLALKVMRLTKPSMYTNVPVHCEAQDLPGTIFKESHDADIATIKGVYNFGLGDLLVLPQTFGNIFLGETFSSYVSVHNDSNQTVKDIVIKTDLQTSSQRLTLSGAANMPVAKLDTQQSYDQVIHHEVKELGTHILVCAVSYSTNAGEKMYFRKFFKFQVLKPLDVKTKFYNGEDDTVFLEAQVQNITSSPMVMESVRLEPSQIYTVIDLNSVSDDSNKLNSEEAPTENVFGRGSFLHPNDTRQYLYMLRTKPSYERNHKSASMVGKLDIVWRTGFGERGRLQTSHLTRVTQIPTDIKLTVSRIPDTVPVETRFPVEFKLKNTCERKMDLRLLMTKSKDGAMMWCGTSGRNIGVLVPGSHLDLKLHLLPLSAGLQSVSGLRVLDNLSGRTYEFDNITSVFVYSCDQSPFTSNNLVSQTIE